MTNKNARKFLVIMDIIIGLLLLFQLLMDDLDLKFLGSVIIVNAFFFIIQGTARRMILTVDHVKIKYNNEYNCRS